MKKILLIGGGGFVGAAVARVLSLDPKIDITVLGRSHLAKNLLPECVSYIKADLLTANLNEILKGFDCIVDLAYASVPSTSYVDPLGDVNNNIAVHVRLFEAAIKNNIPRYIYVSSGGAIYGDQGEYSLKESAPNNPVSPYGITKLTIEKYAELFYRRNKFPVIIVRPSNPYGAEQLGTVGQGFISAVYNSIINKTELNVYGSKIVRDYIYIDDLARAIVLLIPDGRCGHIYNIGSGRGLMNSEVVNILNELLKGSPLKINYLEKRPFDVAFNVLDVSKIFDDTGWSPTIDFRAGVSLMIRELAR